VKIAQGRNSDRIHVETAWDAARCRLGDFYLSLLYFHATVGPIQLYQNLSVGASVNEADVVHPINANVTVKFTLTGAIVLLTGVTGERFDAFERLDDCYRGMWANRLLYAEVHGILPEGLC
jgi:hypothetical protein